MKTSTSIVDPSAVLGQGTTVGEGCVIGPNVRIGAGCRLGHLVVIHPDTAIGNEVRIVGTAFTFAGNFTTVGVKDGSGLD